MGILNEVNNVANEAYSKKEPTICPFIGGCPHCGRYTVVLHASSGQWATCHTCMTRWCIGVILSTPAKYNLIEDDAKLMEYTPVEPVYPCEKCGGRVVNAICEECGGYDNA